MEESGQKKDLNTKVWHYLKRRGFESLRVKKCSKGYNLSEDCYVELLQKLPAKVQKLMMVWIERWLKSLQEKDASNKAETLKDKLSQNAVIELSSEGEDDDSVDSFDCSSFLSKSTLVIHDEDLGDISLKDFAAHVDEANNMDKSTKQSTLNKFLNLPEMEKEAATQGKQPNAEVLVRPALKTFANTTRPKLQKLIIRVRTDLGPLVDNPTEEQPVARPEEASTSKRKLSIDQTPKSCDSSTDTKQSSLKKPNLSTESSPHSTHLSPQANVKAVELPKLIPQLPTILEMLNTVEKYALWQRNLTACDLLDRLRFSLQQAEEKQHNTTTNNSVN